jgi:amino acid transporter
MATMQKSRTRLIPGAVGFLGVLMQGIGSIAPALAALFTIQFIATNAGAAAPIAYVGAFLITLMLGLVLAQFARHTTSAGTYYTFVSQSLSGRAGFLVSWVYLLVYMTSLSIAGTFMAATLSATLQAEYGWNLPWWVFMLYLIGVAFVFTYRGIRLSVGVLVGLGIFEISICLALGLWGLTHPGPGGFGVQCVNPANAPSAHGLFLGVVFAIFAFAGWDAAAPVAEESRQPRRIVPRAVLGSIILLGILLLITSWGQLIGWGTNRLPSLTSSAELPGFVLAHRYWGGAWVIVLIAMVSSMTAAAIAITNVASRVFFSMARSGTMPSALAKLHPRFRTPSNAIWMLTGINLLIGLGVPALIGVTNVFSVGGTMETFAYIPVFIMANIGIYFFFRRRYPGEFRPLPHVVFPVVSSVALLLVGYESLNPFPAYPVSLALPIVIVWLLIGIVVVIVMRARRGDAWLAQAGQAIATSDSADAEAPAAVEPGKGD